MLTFSNPGVIDINGATIAGLSAKETNSPIGLFGTGLKYSIACILRWNGSITIHAGQQTYTFHALDLDFRGRQFRQVAMSHNAATPIPLGFTTEYGKQWEPWMVFRELLANARDEHGDVTRQPAAMPPLPAHTIINVSCPELESLFAERDTIILPAHTTTNADVSTPAVQIIASPSQYICYRGVRVAAHATALTYNVLATQVLTEDRTLASPWSYQSALAQAIQACADDTIIRTALTAHTKPNAYEAQFEYSIWTLPSPEFITIARQLYRIDNTKYEFLRAIIAKHAPEDVEPATITLSATRQRMLDKAIAFAARMDTRPADVTITVADLGPSCLGRYDSTLDKIYLSPEVFNQGTKQVLSTLYEELIHRETGKADCNYDMQTFLFNTIVSMYEEHVFAEPI